MSDTAPKFTDFLGQDVNVGDTVVYATTSGRSPVQKLATVEKILMIEATRPKLDENGEYVRDETNWFVQETYLKPKVGVKEIKNGRGFTRWDSHVWNGERYEYEPGKTRTTYPMPENIVKVVLPE